jgi:hypothetical protein
MENIMKESTCGNCPNLKFNTSTGLAVAYCSATDGEFIVPHEGVLKDGKRGNPTMVTLWRIPSFCPRSDSEVLKSGRQAPRAEWIKREVPADGKLYIK